MGIIKTGLLIDLRLRYYSLFGLCTITLAVISYLNGHWESDLISCLWWLNLYFLIFNLILFSKKNLRVLWNLGYKIKTSILNFFTINFIIQIIMIVLFIYPLFTKGFTTITQQNLMETDGTSIFGISLIIIILNSGWMLLLKNLKSATKCRDVTANIWIILMLFVLIVDTLIINYLFAIFAIIALTYYQFFAVLKGADLYEN